MNRLAKAIEATTKALISVADSDDLREYENRIHQEAELTNCPKRQVELDGLKRFISQEFTLRDENPNEKVSMRLAIEDWRQIARVSAGEK